MGLFDDKIKALQEFQNEGLKEVLVQNSENIIELNRSQMYNGFDGEGQRIKPFYTSFTRQIKRAKGQPTNRVTLLDTGDFYDSIDVHIGATEIELFATDIKTTKLQRKYGKDILGLSDISIQTLINTIKPDLLENLKSRL